jgi:hypothetical protein
MGFFFNDDYRVHINLSNFAWNILNEDMFNFIRDDLNNLSGFINDIFLNFYSEANSSIAYKCDELSSHYEELLSEKSISAKLDPSILYSLIDVVTANYKKQITSIINDYPKERYRKIKLRKNVASILEESDESLYYDNNVGNYLKAIIEEYARLPFLYRENIICKHNYEIINTALRNNKQIRISVRSGKDFEILPYKILNDRLGIFSYLVGIDAESKQTVSYRISKAKMKLLSKSSKITTELKKTISEKISISDVSFLTKDVTRIVVELDEYGIQNYNNQLHMRPNYIELIDSNKFVFNCSTDQIKFYFLKFGSSAKVLEPESLAKSFYKFYKYALSRYQEYSL